MKFLLRNGGVTPPNSYWWSTSLTDNSPPWPLQIDDTPPPAGGAFTPTVGERFALAGRRGLVG